LCEQEKRAKLAHEVEKGQIEINDLKCQLEICGVKIHTLHQEKEKETLDRQEERSKLALEVEKAQAEGNDFKDQLQISRVKVHTFSRRRRKIR
jgi:hypothetical protein